MKNKKILLIIFGCAIIILLTFFITRKIYYINYYNDSKLSFNFKDVSDNYQIKGEINIPTSSDENNDYITLEDIQIKNYFKDYQRDIVSSINGDMTLRYVKEDGAFFSIGITSQYLDLFKNPKELDNYLKSKKITNDLDLVKLIGGEYKRNIFMSAKALKGQYYLYVKANEFDIKNVTLLNGNYKGFMYEAISNVREINLYKNNKRYVLLFAGNDFSLDQIIEILSTIKIA